ncbi:hypothetical protein KR038_002526 [Drosophila bunnanda]|nr:hypothetical protein KR038_002526 [Drosophila bunnanda]
MRLGVLAGPRRLAYIAAYRNMASPTSSDSLPPGRASSMQCSRLRALDAIAPLFFRLREFVCVRTVDVIKIASIKMMATSQDYFGNPYALFRGPPTTLRPRESPVGVGHAHAHGHGHMHGHAHSHAHGHGHHGHAHSHYAALDLQTPHKRNIETDVRAPPPPLPPPPLPLPAASPSNTPINTSLLSLQSTQQSQHQFYVFFEFKFEFK